ncbi:MAG: IS66 family transposase [Chitinophagaceae bacterium]
MFPADAKNNYESFERLALIDLLHDRDREMLILKEEIAGYKKDLAESAQDMKELQRILNLRNKRIFGSTSEKQAPASSPLKNYIDYEEINKDQVVVQRREATATLKKERYPNGHPGRYSLPDHLPRVDVHLYPLDHEGGKEMPPLITERLVLKYEIHIERTIRHKFARGNKFLVAPFPLEDPFYRYKATVQTVAMQLNLRFALHLPYYRFQQLLLEASVNYVTLIGWATRGFELLAPLQPVLAAEVIKDTKLVCMDETGFKVLDTPVKLHAFKQQHKNQEQLCDTSQHTDHSEEPGAFEQEIATGIAKGKAVMKGMMWGILNREQGLILFDFSGTRATVQAKRLLNSYEGLLMTDGYCVYSKLARESEMSITNLNCWAHARRKFLEAKNPKYPDAVLVRIISMIGQLYAIEKQAQGLAPKRIKKLRKRSGRILEKLKAFLEEKIEDYAPKESVRQAIQYCLNIWEGLTQYIKHGHAPIDNNRLERAIRPIAINRKNVLFLGSLDHAQGAALMYSLMECCRMNQIDPYQWLLDVMKRIEIFPKNRLDELLPNKWKPDPVNSVSPSKPPA